jgi:hypothetical protein
MTIFQGLQYSVILCCSYFDQRVKFIQFVFDLSQPMMVFHELKKRELFENKL